MKYIDLQTAFELEIDQLDNNLTKPTTSDIEYWLMAGLDKFIKTAYNTPIIRQPAVALVSDPTTKYNYIEVAVDAYTTLGNVTLTYYRKPLRFNTTNGASKCELPESIHSEIVDLAVNMFITEGKYRLQVKQPNNQQ